MAGQPSTATSLHSAGRRCQCSVLGLTFTPALLCFRCCACPARPAQVDALQETLQRLERADDVLLRLTEDKAALQLQLRDAQVAAEAAQAAAEERGQVAGEVESTCQELRRQLEAARLLLEAGVPADVKNQRMWNPIDEAIALQDAEAVKLLYR